MSPIVHTVTVDNPLLEEWAIDRAKHKFLMANAFLWRDWVKFMPDSEYQRRSEEFNKRIEVLSVVPTVNVVDGWYKVTSVCVGMQYKGGVADGI